MVDVPTTVLGLVKQTVGGNRNTWGTIRNADLDIIEGAVAGMTSKAVTGGSTSLSTSERRKRIINFTGTLTSNQTVEVDNLVGVWLVRNGTSGSYTLSMKTSSGSAVEIPQGGWTTVWCDGNDVVRVGFSTAYFDGTKFLAPDAGFSFKDDTDSALYRIGANNLGVKVNDTKILDIATTGLGITGALTVSSTAAVTGTLSALGFLRVADGTEADPSVAFTNDINTGFYSVSSNVLGIVAGGNKKIDVSSSGVAVTGTLSTTGALSPASMSGTISGTPTFSGAVTFSGNPVFSSNPVFSGNPNFSSGTPTFAGAALGTGTYSGNATFSGAVTFSSASGITGKNTAKAFGYVEGFSSPSLDGSFNIASFSRPSTGVHEFTFTNNMANDNYTIIATAGDARYASVDSKSVSGFTINVREPTANSLSNTAQLNVLVFN